LENLKSEMEGLQHARIQTLLNELDEKRGLLLSSGCGSKRG
jgi:hypothetical protein